MPLPAAETLLQLNWWNSLRLPASTHPSGRAELSSAEEQPHNAYVIPR